MKRIVDFLTWPLDMNDRLWHNVPLAILSVSMIPLCLGLWFIGVGIMITSIFMEGLIVLNIGTLCLLIGVLFSAMSWSIQKSRLCHTPGDKLGEYELNKKLKSGELWQ